MQRDALDRVLTELTTWYRDVLSLQTHGIDPSAATGAHLINADLRSQLEKQARACTAERTLRRIDAILACREALETNVAPLLAMEAMLLSLGER